MPRLLTFTIEAVVDEDAVDQLTWDLEAAVFMRATHPPAHAEAQMIGDVDCVYVVGRVSMPA